MQKTCESIARLNSEHKQRTKCCNLQHFALSAGKNPRKYHSFSPRKCEKRKPEYTSCALKSTLPYKTLRQTQTPTVVATPQLLSSLQCQNKGTCSTPTPKCTSELLLFSPDATVTRNRSTRTKDGTQPRNKGKTKAQEATWLLFHLP